MASELRVNTLKDASGNNSIATSFVAGGSAKAWIQVAMATDTINDSLNASSITDIATGRFTCSLTSSMSGADYPVPMAGMDPANASTGTNRTVDGGSVNASSFYFRGAAYDNTGVDVPSSSCVAHGDLA